MVRGDWTGLLKAYRLKRPLMPNEAHDLSKSHCVSQRHRAPWRRLLYHFPAVEGLIPERYGWCAECWIGDQIEASGKLMREERSVK